MTEPLTSPESVGADVYIITYDEEGNEARLLPVEVTDDTVEQSRDFGIGKGTWTIDRIKHGPLVAAESQLRQVNVGSLGRAVIDNYYGTTLMVDRTAPPIVEDLMDVEKRYHVDLKDEAVVAIVKQRYATQPAQTEQEIAAMLTRIAVAYGCRIADVVFTLPGGGTPKERLALWPEDDELSKRFHQETVESLAVSAHDVAVLVATDDSNTMATLMDGATAISDFMTATQAGALDAVGVLNVLRGGHFKVLIGEKESSYLEVKTALHPIWVAGTQGEKAKIELAQDVARFTNGAVDAILVIGYREAPGGRNEIGSLTPVADNHINVSQIQEVLDGRIIPAVDGLTIETFPVSLGQSVLAIYVPRQSAEMQPYLVHGAVVADKVEGAFFSIVRRRGEGSITTSASQIHAYIVAGKRYLRGED
jgi:hypothetical protein